jgi:hypothetical protein
VDRVVVDAHVIDARNPFGKPTADFRLRVDGRNIDRSTEWIAADQPEVGPIAPFSPAFFGSPWSARSGPSISHPGGSSSVLSDRSAETTRRPACCASLSGAICRDSLADRPRRGNASPFDSPEAAPDFTTDRESAVALSMTRSELVLRGRRTEGPSPLSSPISISKRLVWRSPPRRPSRSSPARPPQSSEGNR